MINPRFQVQRELLGHLVSVGAISDKRFADAMQLVDRAEAKAEEAYRADRERQRREFDERPWWRRFGWRP